MRRIIVALVTTVGIILSLSVAASASANASAHRCTAGTIQWNTTVGPPAVIPSEWHPSNGCNQLQSPELVDTAEAVHYGNAWLAGIDDVSTASSPDAMEKAWIRYKNGPGDQIYCLRVYPTVGTTWYAANGGICP